MTKVLFELHHLYYLPHFEPIIKEMLSRGTYDITLSLHSDVDKWERIHFDTVIPHLGYKVILHENEQRRLESLRSQKFDVVIIGNVGKIDQIALPKSFVVMVYHGIGLKKSYYTDISDRVNLRAVESEERLNELSQKGFKNCILVGLTKLDVFKGVDYRVRITSPTFDPSKKTILYAPSFYPSSLEKSLHYLEELSNEFNIVVKLHHFSWYHRRYRYQSKLVNWSVAKWKYFFVVPASQYNVLPYFRNSDLLVSDISSTIFEYLIENKPIIISEDHTLKFHHRLFPWRLTRRLDVKRMKQIDFAYRLVKSNQLRSLVLNALENPKEMSEKRKAVLRKYLYIDDGKASERLVDAIEKQLKLPNV